MRDPRFEPVRTSELPGLRIEISALSALTAIAPDQIEVGHHGLMVSLGLRRGVLLPQVPVEWKWDRERFLEETCLKAGLPANAWRHGAKIECFTAEIFSE
jgi:AmmeMemoRadiSam system protein A